MKLLRPPPYPVILVAAAVAGVMAARWVVEQEAAAARLAAERSSPPPRDAAADPVEAVEELESIIQEASAEDDESAPAEDDEAGDDWDADAEWEGELAYRVLSEQGAFDVEEIDIPLTDTDIEPVPALEFAEVRVERRSEEEVVEEAFAIPEADSHDAESPPPEKSHNELTGLPRQALFEMAKELGVPMKDLIVMDREELIAAIERAAPIV
jgi:hypothetical protein